MDDERPELDRNELVEFLRIIEEHIAGPVTLVGVGGTGLTLHGAKPSTIDIDFTGPTESIQAFEEALATEAHGYRVDRWMDGAVFDVTFPKDYIERATRIGVDLQMIALYALHPVDIIVHKISRYDARDREDIRAAVDVFNLDRKSVADRASEVEYLGSRDKYEANLGLALGECFQ